MNLLTAIQNKTPEKPAFSYLKLLYSQTQQETRKETVYRKNGKYVDKIIEYNVTTGAKIKTTYFDYFDDKKIRSIDEYDAKSGRIIRTTNFVLYKSVDEFDIETGKKIRTINFNLKDDTKISSVQEYDINTGKIITISIYKKDGKTVSIVKKVNPKTGKTSNWFNNNLSILPSKTSIQLDSYKNLSLDNNGDNEEIAKLIDNLYSNKMKFEHI